MAFPTVLSNYNIALAGGSVSWNMGSVTVPSGTVDPMIVVMFSAGANAAMNGASWNGEAFTLDTNPVHGYYARMAYLIPSSSGTYNLLGTVPFFGSNAVICAWVLSNAKAVSPTADMIYVQPYGTVCSASLTTKANNSLVIDYAVNINPTFGGAAPDPTQGAGQTVVTNRGYLYFRQTTGYKQVATKGTISTFSITAPADNQMGMDLFEVMSEAPAEGGNFFAFF